MISNVVNARLSMHGQLAVSLGIRKLLAFGSTLSERNDSVKRDVYQIPDTRLSGPILSHDSYRYLHRIVWDTPSQRFIHRVDGLNRVIKATSDGYREIMMPQATVLSREFIEGAVVDQVNQKILLPDGRSIDGPTGNVLNVHGDVLVYGNKDEALNAKKGNTSKNC